MPESPIDRSASSFTWTQLSLLNFPVVEISLRIGIVAETDHLQWMITTRDPVASTLLGMQSSPAVSAARWPRELELITRELNASYENHVSPF